MCIVLCISFPSLVVLGPHPCSHLHVTVHDKTNHIIALITTRWEGLNAWKRNVSNENKEKSRVSKGHCCIELKKKVSGDFFVIEQLPYLSNCNGSVSWLAIYIATYMAEFFVPYLCKYSVLETIKQVTLVSICIEKWKLPIITFNEYYMYIVHPISVQHNNMVGLSWMVTY